MKDLELLKKINYHYIEDSDVENIVKLWNEEVYQKEIYAEFSTSDFQNRFLQNPS